MNERINPTCAANHLSKWLAWPEWMNQQVSMYRAGVLRNAAMSERGDTATYSVDGAGIATFHISGALMKSESKMVASTSTADLRRQFRNALRDPDVKGGMMLIDSPGGTVAGTDELASDIKAFAKQKPLHAHGEGVIASAAYWLAVQASRVSATRLTDVGSIGVVASVYDESGMYEAAGIKVHVISTGPDKGAFIPGTEVTGEQLEMIQSEVDDIFATFKAEVRKGRSMSDAQFGKVSSGRTWVGTKAVELGLIDAVEGVDDAYTNLARAIRQRKTEDNRRAETIKNIKANM